MTQDTMKLLGTHKQNTLDTNDIPKIMTQLHWEDRRK